jgi:hypothetical protein
VQAVYLVTLIGVLLAIVVPLILRLSALYGIRDTRTQLVVTFTAALIGALLIVSLRADLVPDNLEAVLALALIPIGTLALAWLGWLLLRAR